MTTSNATTLQIEALTAAIDAHPLDWREHCLGDPEVGEAVMSLARALQTASVAQQTEALRPEFNTLADIWREETSGYSFSAQSTDHPAYRRIIGMGRPALPLIFEQLAQHGGQWYVALHAITDANPIPPEDRGHRAKTREAWLNWAREHKIISW